MGLSRECFVFPILYSLVIVGTMAISYSHLQTKLTYQIIENHFGDCYMIKVRKQATTTFTDTVIKVPVIDINFDKEDYNRVLDHFADASRHSLMTKLHRQCIVYYISLAGFDTTNLDALLETFQIQTLEIEATYSYIIVSEFNTEELSKAFMFSPKLKNFQHRGFLQPIVKGFNTEFKFHRFCYFCSDGSPGIITEDTIYQDVFEVEELDKIFPDMTKNFNQKTLRVIAPPAPPLVLIVPSKTEPGKNDIHGQHGVILKSLAHHFNFTYTLKTIPLTGVKLPNGTWNGIMGDILYDKADIGLSVATSYDRYKIADVTTAVFYAFLVLVSTKPTPTFEWQAVFYPFKTNCWLAFIFSIALTFVASKWLHNTSIKYEIPLTMKGRSKRDIRKKLQAEFMTNYRSFYLVVGNLLEQGPPFDFNSIPSRMFVTFWMFFTMIITTAYRSKLFTFLTFPTIEVPPSSFLELVHSSYQFGMKHIGGIAFIFITKSPLSYVRTIGEKMTVYNDKYSCLDRTFSDRFTCIIYRTYIDYLMETRYWKIRQNFHISDFVSPPVGSSWVFPKHAPWFPTFDKACFPIFEMGLAEKYLYDYQVNIAQVLREKAKVANSTQDVFDLNANYKSDDGGPKPLVMANLYAAFFILIFGVAVSAIFLAFEVARKKKLDKRLRTRQHNLRIHLRRKLKMKKRELEIPRGQRLPLRQIVKIIGPNSNDIIELECNPRKGKNTMLSTVAILRNLNHHHYY